MAALTALSNQGYGTSRSLTGTRMRILLLELIGDLLEV